MDVKVRKSGAAAAPTEQMNRTNMAMLYACLRPIISLIGPQIKDELPMAMITAALLILMISVVVENSEAISGIAGRREVLEKVMARVIQLTMKRMVIFRQKEKLEYVTVSTWFVGDPAVSSELVRTESGGN